MPPDGPDGPDPAHRLPDEADRATMKAVGDLTEALESVERARGHLYSFHQLIGKADLGLDDVVAGLRGAGHDDLARAVADQLLGRNLLPGRWSFQIVEEFDDGYWSAFRAVEQQVREELMGGRRHVYEADMKEQRRTHGHPDHTARPTPGS